VIKAKSQAYPYHVIYIYRGENDNRSVLGIVSFWDADEKIFGAKLTA
jgi:hypothetical protein